MKRLKKTDYIIISIILLLVIGIVLYNLGSNVINNKASEGPAESDTEITYESFNGKRIGIRTGTSFEALTLEHFPDSEYSYYDTDSDLITALTNNKIDGFLNDEPVSAMIHIEHRDVDYMKELLVDDDYYWGFTKGSERSDKIREEFNETLRNLRKSGELDNIKAKWMGEDESAKTYDKSELSGENGTLFVADQNVEDLLAAVRRINAYRDAMERVRTNFTPMLSKPMVPVEGKIVLILQTLSTLGTVTLRELLDDAPSLADMIASFMGVLELIKVRRILMEEPEESENAVGGEETRFFLNPDAPRESEAAAKT